MKRKAFAFTMVLVVLASFVFVGCGGKDKDRTVYNITCTFNNNTLVGSQTVDFFNDTENTITQLKFNLFGNAFREDAKYKPISRQYENRAYPNGQSYGNVNVKSVTEKDLPLMFSVEGEDENVLTINLAKEVFPDEKVSVTIDFELSLANVIARTGYNEKTVNLANFYPILCGLNEDGSFYECLYYSNGDPFFSDCADYNVEITLDSNYTVATSGKTNSVTQNGMVSTHTFSIENARSFAMVLSKDFQSIVDNSTGVEITYYYYSDSTPEKSLKYAVQSMGLFGEKFGKYPYPTYSVVQTQFIQGGMEFPGLVMISDSLEEIAYGEVIVHETAHQWWQTTVGNNEVEHGFLDEGLAEYSVVVFFESYSEYGLKRENLITASEKTYKTYCTVYDKLFGKVDTTMDRSLKDFTSEYEYVNIAYIKTCIMYDYLRESIGDEKFYKGLKRYYSDNKFENAVPDDLVGAFEKVGADTNGFFQSFFEGKVII